MHTAPHGRNDPKFIPNPSLAIGTHIAIKGPPVRDGLSRFEIRLVGIFQQTAQVGTEVMQMHPGARLSIPSGAANGKAMFNDGLATGDRRQGELMATGNIFGGSESQPGDFNWLTSGYRTQSHGNVVCRVETEDAIRAIHGHGANLTALEGKSQKRIVAFSPTLCARFQQIWPPS